MKIKTRTIELTGSNYETGTTLGKMTASVKPLRGFHTAGFKGFDNAEVEKAAALFSNISAR